MSTPDQDTAQRKTHNDRLQAIQHIKPPLRLQFLNKDIAKEVELRKQEETVQGNFTKL